CFAIENENKSTLRGQSKSGDPGAVPDHLEKNWSRFQVVVPDVVMNGLEIPFQFAGLRVERDQTVTVKIGAFAVGTMEIVGRRTMRQIDKTRFRIQADQAPDIRSGTLLPVVAFPCLTTWLSGARNRVKLPDEFARVSVPRSCVSSESQTGLFLNTCTGDDEVL